MFHPESNGGGITRLLQLVYFSKHFLFDWGSSEVKGDEHAVWGGRPGGGCHSLSRGVFYWVKQ